LFRIERPGVPHSYVFGTLHSNDPRVTALPPAVTDALSRSRTAAFETVLTDRDLAEFFAAAQFDDARKLTDLVDAATIARIREALGNDAPDEAVLAKLKPWAVLLLLGQAPLGGAPSLDIVLKAEARRRDLAVVGLELADEQVASLDAIPLASQLALMHWVLTTWSARTADMEATTHAWLAGDLAKLHALARKPGVETPALAPHFDALLRHLIVDRTVVMAHRMHLPLARGRVFVAVGALHLYGRSGLLAVLARNGYRIRRVFRRAGPRHAARYNAHSSLERSNAEPRRSAHRVPS
jgi:uncharacterized protein YbaP (TraB family)